MTDPEMQSDAGDVSEADSESMGQPPVTSLEALRSLRMSLGSRTELRAVELMRQKVWRHEVDATIEEALTQLPASAGPLNSHGLVLKAMTALDDRAPDYFRNLVGYLEALLWLEEQA